MASIIFTNVNAVAAGESHAQVLAGVTESIGGVIKGIDSFFHSSDGLKHDFTAAIAESDIAINIADAMENSVSLLRDVRESLGDVQTSVLGLNHEPADLALQQVQEAVQNSLSIVGVANGLLQDAMEDVSQTVNVHVQSASETIDLGIIRIMLETEQKFEETEEVLANVADRVGVALNSLRSVVPTNLRFQQDGEDGEASDPVADITQEIEAKIQDFLSIFFDILPEDITKKFLKSIKTSIKKQNIK